jgi:DNA helicase-2/ATP-dependent DNA helicase PcrA
MYVAQARSSQSEGDEARVENLAELVSSARQFELEFDPTADPAAASPDAAAPPLLAMLRAYLESVALVADADAVDPAQGAVTLMTLHAAKGLEFQAVAMIGLEEGMLPHARSRESEAMVEEERRLCFVGVTRAMRRLLVTNSKYRTLRGVPERTIPSRFIEEFGREHVLLSDQGDTLGGLEGSAWNEGGGTAADNTRPTRTMVNVSPAAAKFPVGCLVRHPQFGLGRVESISGGVINGRAVIQFQGTGRKTLVLEYARLQRVDAR